MKAAALAVSIIATGLAGIAVLTGILYEQGGRARDRVQYPQVGRAVNLAGRTLNIYCSGTGQPTVIFARGSSWSTYKTPQAMFANGAPRPGYSWVWIQRELAKATTACWFDRAGSGWSDLGPYPRDSASQARDLHAVLRAAEVPRPYVLVAESSAMLDARVYTDAYPAEVAGLVFVDGVDPDYFIGAKSGRGRGGRFPGFVGHGQDVMAHLFNWIGLYRLGAPAANHPALTQPPKELTVAEWNAIWHLTGSGKARSAMLQDIASWQQSTQEARSARNLGGRPLIVLSSENTDWAPERRSAWIGLQNDLARLSSQGKQVTNASNGDLIYDAPASIVEAVGAIVGDIRKQAGLAR